MIKVAVVDDSSFLRDSIVEKIGFFNDVQCLFTAGNGKEFLNKIEKYPVTDLVLMDIEMPLMNGIDTTFELKKRLPGIKVVILTVFDNDENIFNAIKAGADGYILKECDPEELYKAITETRKGGAYMTPSIAMKTLRMFRDDYTIKGTQDNETLLTQRENEVLEYLATGQKYEQIAETLFVSSGTIRKHIENIYAKLQAHNKLEAIAIARKNKIIR